MTTRPAHHLPDFCLLMSNRETWGVYARFGQETLASLHHPYNKNELESLEVQPFVIYDETRSQMVEGKAKHWIEGGIGRSILIERLAPHRYAFPPTVDTQCIENSIAHSNQGIPRYIHIRHHNKSSFERSNSSFSRLTCLKPPPFVSIKPESKRSRHKRSNAWTRDGFEGVLSQMPELLEERI